MEMSQKQFDNKPRHAYVGTATAWDALKAFWRGIRCHKLTLIGAVFGVIVSQVFGVIVPVYYKQFFDILNTQTISIDARSAVMLHLILLILGLHGIVWLAFRVSAFCQTHFQALVIGKLKQQAFDYMIDHSYAFYANNFTGSLVQRVNRFARAFEVLSDRVIYDILPIGVQLIGIAIVLWYINPLITELLIVWAVIFLAFNYFFSRWKLKYDIRRAALDSFTTGVLSDALTNQNTIQLFTGVKAESGYFRDVTNDQARLTRFAWNLQNVVDTVQSLLIFGIEFLMFYFAIRYWREGLVTVGTFVLIQVYLIGLGGRLWDFSRVIRSMYEASADAKEMVDILKLPHDVKDAPRAGRLAVPNGEVRFENVGFTFEGRRAVLSDLNLNIAAGEKVALVGPSGAGKSTFVKLLLRLYDVSSGRILIDGTDIRTVKQESLRKNLSLVPQDPILFHRTLLENIRYGRRDATDTDALAAARLAHCDEFALSLPAGYGTYVGERGIKLSGGERQRVAIARAILKNAPILILDEATSSLDSHSESLIQDALDKLMKGKTVIVIAHRLSTIRKMDRILVIEKGKIIEEGSHAELLEDRSGLYAKLWKLQAGGFIRRDE